MKRQGKPAQPNAKARVAEATANVDRKAHAIELLAEGRTDREIAEAIGIATSTIWRWKTDDAAFKARVADLRRERIEAARCNLDRLGTRAIDVLAAVLEDDQAPHAARVRSAESVLDRIGLSARREGVTENGTPVVPDQMTVDETRALLLILRRRHPQAFNDTNSGEEES